MSFQSRSTFFASTEHATPGTPRASLLGRLLVTISVTRAVWRERTLPGRGRLRGGKDVLAACRQPPISHFSAPKRSLGRGRIVTYWSVDGTEAVLRRFLCPMRDSTTTAKEAG